VRDIISEPSFIGRVTGIRHYSCCYLKVANPYKDPGTPSSVSTLSEHSAGYVQYNAIRLFVVEKRFFFLYQKSSINQQSLLSINQQLGETVVRGDRFIFLRIGLFGICFVFPFYLATQHGCRL
jgi:hypothetical protein